MIALIITGHGKFATAMSSALKVIAGEQPHITFVDFDDDSVEKLQNNLQKAMDSYKDADGILVLSDLVGGSPFKVSSELSLQTRGPTEVIGGANLSMIIEVAMMRQWYTNFAEIADDAVRVGKENIIKFVLQEHQQDEDGDGI